MIYKSKSENKLAGVKTFKYIFFINNLDSLKISKGLHEDKSSFK